MQLRDGPLEKLLGGGGGEFSSRRDFFSLSNSLYDFILGHSMKFSLGLIGVHEFFSFKFPLCEYFFCTSPVPQPPAPPPPISFLMVRPLNELISFQLCGKLIHIITSPYLTDKGL